MLGIKWYWFVLKSSAYKFSYQDLQFFFMNYLPSTTLSFQPFSIFSINFSLFPSSFPPSSLLSIQNPQHHLSLFFFSTTHPLCQSFHFDFTSDLSQGSPVQLNDNNDGNAWYTQSISIQGWNIREHMPPQVVFICIVVESTPILYNGTHMMLVL